MATKAKPSRRVKAIPRKSRSKRATLLKSALRKPKQAPLKPYDAKKYAGSVPAFASVVAEEMKSWRDDR